MADSQPAAHIRGAGGGEQAVQCDLAVYQSRGADFQARNGYPLTRLNTVITKEGKCLLRRAGHAILGKETKWRL